MADQGPAAQGLPHVWVTERSSDRLFHRTGGGDPRVRDVERRTHGPARRQELDDAIAEQLERRGEIGEDQNGDLVRCVADVAARAGTGF